MLYNETFGKADFLYLTRIYAEAENADTFFPEVDEMEWDVVRESQLLHDEENDIDFKFIVYKRRR